MSSHEIAFLCMVVAAITLFGGVLAWASWMESRDKRRPQTQRQSRGVIEPTEEQPGEEMQMNKRRAF